MFRSKNNDEIEEFVFDIQRLQELCTEEEWDQLNKLKSETKVKKGQVLFYEDANPLGIYCILDGVVKLYKTSPDGKQHILQLTKDCEIIGIVSCFTDQPHTVTAEALEEAQITIIPKDEFLRIIEANDKLKKEMLYYFSVIVTAYRKRMLDLATKPVKARLAEVLIYLQEFYNPKKKEGFHISRDNIANLVGTSRETVIRILSDFQDQKLVELPNRHIVIKKLEMLKEIGHNK